MNTSGNAGCPAEAESRSREIPKLMRKRAVHRRASRQSERKARQRKAKANGTRMDPPKQQRILPKCKEQITVRCIINTEARYANRKRPKGWLTPTVRQCVQAHLNMVDRIRSILLVTDWTPDVNRFAFMRMEDGSVKGIDFRNGALKRCFSVEDYVCAEQDGRYPFCGKPIEHCHHRPETRRRF